MSEGRTIEESGATFAMGIVTAVNADRGWARVKLPAYDNLESMELPVVQKRTHKDKALDLPDVGEQVVVLLDRRGEDGAILGAVWSDADPVPQGDGPDVDVRRYEDGTVLRYDRKAHKLTGEVKGEVEIVAEKAVRVESQEALTLSAPAITVEANALSVVGYGGGGAAQAQLRGDFNVAEGDIKAEGVSLRHHVHKDVESGGSVSGQPVE